MPEKADKAEHSVHIACRMHGESLRHLEDVKDFLSQPGVRTTNSDALRYAVAFVAKAVKKDLKRKKGEL